MLKRILASLISMVALAVCAQTEAPDTVGLTAHKCFTAAPTTVFNLLDSNTRLDMLDYYRAGIHKPSINAAEGESYVIDEAPYSITIAGGNGIKYQLFVLNPLMPKPIIGLIETIDTPIPDSTVKFYNTKWGVITGLFSQPTLAEWALSVPKSQLSLVYDTELPFIISSMEFDPESGILTVSNNMDQYFRPDDQPKQYDKIAKSLTYKWDGKRFRPTK